MEYESKYREEIKGKEFCFRIVGDCLELGWRVSEINVLVFKM